MGVGVGDRGWGRRKEMKVGRGGQGVCKGGIGDWGGGLGGGCGWWRWWMG